MTANPKRDPQVEADLSGHTGQTKECLEAWHKLCAKRAREGKRQLREQLRVSPNIGDFRFTR